MRAKRAFDICASVMAITALSPVFATVALTSAVHFGGNPFLVVERIGKDRVPFGMIKFRSMNEERGADGQLLPDESRTTGFGKFLRATAIDELPQLLNILKGDMSFVGPRPREPELTGEDYVPQGYDALFSVHPGLTGPWQVAVIGRDGMPPLERAKLEADYAVGTHRLFDDLALLLKTIPAFVKGHDGESLAEKHPEQVPGGGPAP